ncbi:hypothetical protein [Streptomyces sp. NPDC001083]|uniref:hypothetical protein n=1 Tax=Streptomyces sp. NPDC001083 TaxID=3364545 RepID=UPI0036C00FAE
MTARCADRAPGTAADRVGGTGIRTHPPSDGADARLLTAVLYGAFFLLLGGAFARFPLNHPARPVRRGSPPSPTCHLL